MEAEGSASKVSDTSTALTASSLAPNGSTPSTPETTSTMTQKEILRERYLKGVKKRKCSVCGNTARARSSNSIAFQLYTSQKITFVKLWFSVVFFGVKDSFLPS